MKIKEKLASEWLLQIYQSIILETIIKTYLFYDFRNLKKQVDWYEGSHTYALKASMDSRLLIRAAPIPQAGSPWPMPQIYYSDPIQFRLQPSNFHFYVAGEGCDILNYGFARTRRNMFGDDPPDDTEEYDWSDVVDIHYLNVTVLKECDRFPSLESDEACKYSCKKKY